MLAHARSALTMIRFIIIPSLFFADTHKLPFFLWISCALCVPLLPLMSQASIPLPLHLPLPPSFHDHLSGIRDFRCQKHILSQLVINERPYSRNSILFVPLSKAFFSVSEITDDISGGVWISHYDIGCLKS